MSKLRDFFYLQRNDRHAILAILLVVLLCITGLLIFDNVGMGDSSSSASSLSSDSIIQHATREHPAYAEDDMTVHEVFAFDPNTASASDLERLGLHTWQVKGILKYRSKGGVYRTPNDFARVFGMTKKQFETLLPFIKIGEDYRPASEFYGRDRSSPYKGRPASPAASYYQERTAKGEGAQDKPEPVYSYPRKLKAGERVWVNAADTADLMRIPGIGPYYAKSILRYRDRLGGFVSARQVLEVEGVPEQTVDFIQVDASQLRKLEINKFSVAQLRRHPYLNFYQAKEIFDHRRMYGPIKDIEALRLLKEFPPAEIERLKPYLAY